MNQRLESILSEWDQRDLETKLQEELFDQNEPGYNPFATAGMRVYAFPYDEPCVPEGDEKFGLLEKRFREFGREIRAQYLFPTLCEFKFGQPHRKAALKLLIMACKNTPKGEIAAILRKQKSDRVFHQGIPLVPDFESREQSPTIAYGIYVIHKSLIRELKRGARTPPMTQVQLARHAGVDVDPEKIRYWIKSGKLNGLGEGQKQEWLLADGDKMSQILDSIQDEKLGNRKKSQKSPKKTGNKKQRKSKNR